MRMRQLVSKSADAVSTTELRTGAWYGDEIIRLDFPADWEICEVWPTTPPSLTDEEIAASLESPVGQPPMKQMCQGKSRPLVIVDDLNRPTPASRVLPFLLKQFREAGISAQEDRKSTRLNSSHGYISYAVFCLKKKKRHSRNEC